MSTPASAELLAHSAWLKRLAMGLVRSESAAEDLVQDTWLVALNAGAEVSRAARPWWIRVLQLRARSASRASRRRAAREHTAAAHEALPSTAALSERAELGRELLDAVLGLPELQRQALLLRYFEDLPVRRIAELSSESEAAVRSRTARALAALKVELDRRSGGDRGHWMASLIPFCAPHVAHMASPLLTKAVLTGVLMSKFTKTLAIVAFALIAFVTTRVIQRDEASEPDNEHSAVQTIVAQSSTIVDTDEVDLARPAATPARVSGVESTEALVPNAPAGLAARVRGVLLDKRSGHPVPYFALGLASGRGDRQPEFGAGRPTFTERVVTDGEGQFESHETFAAGPMHAVLLEEWERANVLVRRTGATAPRQPLLFEHDLEDARGLRLELEVGVSTFVRGVEVADAVDWSVALRDPKQPDRTFGATTLIATGTAAPSAWLARFAPTDRSEELPDVATLALEATALGRAGSATISTASSWPLPVVTIEFGETASVQVAVTAEGGMSPEEVTLRVYSGARDLDTLGDSTPIASWMTSYGVAVGLGGNSRREDWRPKFSASRLAPGVHTLVIEAPGFEAWVEVVELAAGMNERRAVMRRSAARTGSIAGVVTTESGAAPSVTWVAYVHRMDGRTPSNARMVQLQGAIEGGRWRAQFRAADLVEGVYDVWIRPGPREGRREELKASPRQRGVTLGREDLRFEVLDGSPAHEVEVTVIDGRSGGPMAEFDLMLVKKAKEASIEVDPRPFTAGVARLQLANDPGAAFLGVGAPGLASTFQTLPEYPDPDGTYRASVVLMPGWGAPVQVFQRVDGSVEAIADAEVLADGRSLARTNQQGWCTIQLAARPKHLEVRHPSFVLERAEGPIDASGDLLPAEPGLTREMYGFILEAR